MREKQKTELDKWMKQFVKKYKRTLKRLAQR